MVTSIPKATFEFLKKLKENNNREWMLENKEAYKIQESELKKFYDAVEIGLRDSDEIASTKIYRIYRDVRFSKNKTPYNIHRSAMFLRSGMQRRGEYYLRLQPGNTYIAGGIFDPNPAELLRIRKEFEMDSSEIREILLRQPFKKAFDGLVTEDTVKTAPKGFDRDDPNIDLIKLKSFFVRHRFADEEVTEPDFREKVLENYRLLRPFFDYLSEVLTTDLNGISIID